MSISAFPLTSGFVTKSMISQAAADQHLFLTAALARVYRHHGPEGILARSWPTGSMVLWVAILLASYLAIYYVGAI